MRAGKPMLVVPFSHDQPDNAARATRMGIACILRPTKYSAESAAGEIGILLNDRRAAEKASEIGKQVASEDGASRACDLVEKVMG